MNDTVIRVENLSKSYVIGHQRNRHDGLRHRIEDALRHPFGWLRNRIHERQTEKEEFWALKDVSFEVKQGEVVGIIGRNGAGKSTLLKILSRITDPTGGKIRLHGRVASLLEVGTGFHPELTGRENIFLNGAILGMTKVEIKRKFDEIVAFSEIEKFLDTPVKRYSSGMYVRLAFAVAAHLEPEILVVDEVLAVGDAEFQKKCLGKMQNVSEQEGRTVLFVSHNMEAILRLCQRCVLLQQGKLDHIGDVKSAIARYTGGVAKQPGEIDLRKRPRTGGLRQKIQFRKVRLDAASHTNAWHFPFGAHLKFELEVESQAAIPFAEVGVSVFSATGLEIISTLSSNVMADNSFKPRAYVYSIDLGSLYLLPGAYRISLGLRSNFGMEDYLCDAVEFEVENSELSAKFRTDTFAGLMSPPATYLRHELNHNGEPALLKSN